MSEPATTRLSFSVRFACTSPALSELLHSVKEQPLVADLSLGSAMAHSIAMQLAAQIGLTLPRPPRNDYRALGRNGLSYADLISYGIDAESVGNRVIDAALAFARLFGERQHTIAPFVIVPRAGAQWEDEDVLFLGFLARRLGPGRVRLVACDGARPELPPEWIAEWENEPQAAAAASPSLLSLVPGIIGPDLAPLSVDTNECAGVRLRDGWSVVAPERRRAPGEVAKLDWDRLAVRAKELDPAVAAFAQYHGNNLYVDCAALCRQAWAQFADGGLGIALRYMDRVEACAASASDRALAQAQKQGMRIAQLRFAEAAGEPLPSAKLPPELQSFLLQAKGWGSVQAGAAAEARTLFSQAEASSRAPDTNSDTREVLYLLNIKALAELRCGNAEEALRIEQRIEREIDGLDVPDWQLTYINAINQARLHKHLRDWQRCDEYYRRAFGTTWGLRSESDLVYTNVCLAALAESAGRYEDALLAWIRAGLHWVASARPEALTWRIAQALVAGLTVRDALYVDCARLVDQVSAALLRKLDESARAGGVVLSPNPSRAARFARIEDVVECELHAAIGENGWSVLVATAQADTTDRGEAHAHLRAWLQAWIETDGSVAVGDTFVVDARCGREVATTFEELLETCVRRRVTDVAYQGESRSIDAETRRTLERNTTVRLGAGAEVIGAREQRSVRFKRYRPPRSLTVEEARLVEGIEHGAIDRDDESLIRSLEEARVIECILERRACVAAGIRLPSTAT